MPRFVLLRHTLPPDRPGRSHWDFMIESGDVLKTWALPESPLPESPKEPPRMIALALADHRLAYLDYEGPISGDRGEVRQLDGGTYEAEVDGDEQWVVRLAGRRARGRVTLCRLAGDPQRWSFLFEPE